MKRIIIFDFNRTLFDPDSNRLVPGALRVLESLQQRGFKLYLISRAGAARKKLIESLGIKKYFARVTARKEKRFKDFAVIAGRKSVDVRESFVIGDQLDTEIAFGNRLGLTTIWINRERVCLPEESEKSTFTVRRLDQVLNVIN